MPSKYAEPPQPHQSTTCSFWEFRKVSDTMLQYWMLIAQFGCLRCMGGSRKFCLGEGMGVLKTLFFFTEGSADLAYLSKQLDPKRVLLHLEVVNNSISKKHKTTCGLPGGMRTLCPPPSGHAYAMLSKQSELCSSVSSSLLNIQADRRSHPAYFSWRIVSSPDDLRRPSCQLLV